MTASGLALTLLNPEYITRQIEVLDSKTSGIQGHLVSLTPTRPEDAPDKWEAAALKSLQQGTPEVSGLVDMAGQTYLRLMRPVVVEQACPACHYGTEDKVGYVRGGLSVSVPMAPVWAEGAPAIFANALTGGSLWLIGMIGLVVANRRSVRSKRQHQEAYASLGESEDKYRTLVEAMDDPVVVKDTAGRYIVANEAAALMHGRARAEFIGKTAAEVFGPEAAREMMENDRRVVAEGAVIESDEDHSMYEGGRIYHRRKSPLRDAAGRVVGIVSVGRDITERKRAEETLRESEERYRSLFVTAHDAIFVTDANGLYVDVNQQASALTGYSYDELLAMSISDLLAPEGRATGTRMFGELIATGRVKGEVWLQHKDGRKIDAELSTMRVGLDHFQAIVRDITGLRQLEEARARLAAIVESSHDAIVGETLEGLIVSWNPAAQQLFGYAAAEVMDLPVLLLFPPSKGEEVAGILERIGAGQKHPELRHGAPAQGRNPSRRRREHLSLR